MYRIIRYFLVSLVTISAQESISDDPFSTEHRLPVEGEFVESKPVLDVDGRAFFKVNSVVLDAETLKLCGEKSLFDRKNDEPVFRLTISPTFGKPLVIRSSVKDERPFIEIRRLSGRSGYELGELEVTGSVEFSSEIHDIIWEVLKSTSFKRISSLTFEQRYGLSGLDGAWISFEISDEDGYRVAELWSPGAYVYDNSEFGVTQDNVDEFISLYTRICVLGGVNFGDKPTAPQHNP